MVVGRSLQPGSSSLSSVPRDESCSSLLGRNTLPHLRVVMALGRDAVIPPAVHVCGDKPGSSMAGSSVLCTIKFGFPGCGTGSRACFLCLPQVQGHSKGTGKHLYVVLPWTQVFCLRSMVDKVHRPMPGKYFVPEVGVAHPAQSAC